MTVLQDYLLSRILKGQGFDDVVNMSGGFTLYSYLKTAYPEKFR